jgi:hypothetical protein
MPFKKTLIVWRRTGKEHREDTGFTVNTPEVVKESLITKRDKFQQTSEADWSWWQFNDDLLVEKNRPGNDPNVLYYHLLKYHWIIVENATIAHLGSEWTWYVHIGDTVWDKNLDCWVFTDLFIDVLVHRDCRTHTLVDMDDLAQAINIGLALPNRVAHILHHTQTLVETIHSGNFPPPEILPCRDELRKQGLVP